MERGGPVGGRLKEGIWQPIGFVSRTEGGAKDDVNRMPDLRSCTSSLSCVAFSEAGLWPKCSPRQSLQVQALEPMIRSMSQLEQPNLFIVQIGKLRPRERVTMLVSEPGLEPRAPHFQLRCLCCFLPILSTCSDFYLLSIPCSWKTPHSPEGN